MVSPKDSHMKVLIMGMKLHVEARGRIAPFVSQKRRERRDRLLTYLVLWLLLQS